MVKRLGNITVAIALGLLLSGTAAKAEEINTMTTTAPLNVRNGAGTQYSVLGSYDQNTNIEVISIEDGWAKVSYNGRTAYCSERYLKDISTASTNQSSTKTMKTTANLNVRTGEGTKYEILGSLKKGTTIPVISISNGWVKITFNGETGYCSAEYLKNVAGDEQPAETYTMMESTTYVNVRKGPGTSYEKLGLLNPREKVKVTSTSNGWNRIEYNGQAGYVSSSYVVLVNSDSNNNKMYHYSKELSFTLDNFISGQATKANTSSKGEAINADTLNTYLNPDLIVDRGNVYQFLRINKFRDNINAEKLNNYLNSLEHDTFHGQGQAFIDAAREYNIDTLYLVAHTILETGYGKSALARGVDYEIPEEQSAEKNAVRVYNLFGIGAVDGDPIGGGAATAYNNGWTSIDLAIKGGAQWISENYIHSSRFGQNQYTVYMMRWNTNNYISSESNVIWHQYAADITWTDSISSLMKELSYIYEDAVLELEIPVFLKE